MSVLPMSTLDPEFLRPLINDYTRHVVISLARPRDALEDRAINLAFDPLGGILNGIFGGDDATPIHYIPLSDQLIGVLHIGKSDAPIAQRIQALNGFPSVKWVDRNVRVRFPDVFLADSAIGTQWALDQMEARAAWSRLDERQRMPTKVSIVDWGVFKEHEDLPAERISGFSVIGGTFNDDNGHGTLLAGTIAAAENARGITGLARHAEVIVAKFADARTVPTAAWAGTAIRVATTAGAKVINGSWDVGLDDTKALYDAIRFAGDQGVTFVAAAGNSNNDNTREPVLPACYDLPNVISVMASDSQGQKASFSNYGENVHIAAPGVDILSTYPYLSGPQFGYRPYSGTSASAAHVTGAVALLLSLDSTLTPSLIREHLIASAMPSSGLQGLCQAGGYLNLRRAIRGPLVVDKPTGGEVLPRQSECEVTWHSEYDTPLIKKRWLSIVDLDTGSTIGDVFEVAANGQQRFPLPTTPVQRAVICIACHSDFHRARFYTHSQPFTVS